ncbi:MAG TPA: hypothetical protein VGA37_11410 [Gemmatimonadales bacterium]
MLDITYERHERSCRLRGYAPTETDATVELVTFNRAQRMRRAWLGLATWWAAAVASVFIPIAHFALVPGFFLFGIYSFSSRVRTSTVAVSARGICPDCGEEQEFDLPPRWRETIEVACGGCSRALRLSAR